MIPNKNILLFKWMNYVVNDLEHSLRVKIATSAIWSQEVVFLLKLPVVENKAGNLCCAGRCSTVWLRSALHVLSGLNPHILCGRTWIQFRWNIHVTIFVCSLRCHTAPTDSQLYSFGQYTLKWMVIASVTGDTHKHENSRII